MSRRYPSRPWVSAHAIIFNEEEKVLLTKRASPPKSLHWFPPGGAIDLGETVKEGLTREVLEETSIKISNLNFLDYIDGITNDESGKVLYHFVVLIFTADYTEGDIHAADDALDAQWYSLKMIDNGKILVPTELKYLIEKIKQI